jgi:hypothetical protein
MVLIMPRSRAVRPLASGCHGSRRPPRSGRIDGQGAPLNKPQADPGEAIETGVAALAARLDRLQAPAAHAALNRSTAD